MAFCEKFLSSGHGTRLEAAQAGLSPLRLCHLRSLRSSSSLRNRFGSRSLHSFVSAYGVCASVCLVCVLMHASVRAVQLVLIRSG